VEIGGNTLTRPFSVCYIAFTNYRKNKMNINGTDQTQIPPHLVPFEKAARIYCERAGLDPDATVKVPHALIANMLVDSLPQWTDIADRLLDLSMLLSSMKAARDEPVVLVQ
jgi:hypothetical protein